MRQFITIASNAFMELVRQPIFLLLLTGSAIFEIFLAPPYYFAFGDEPKLVKNSTLAVMLLAGLLGAVLSASASLARENSRRNGAGRAFQTCRTRPIFTGQIQRIGRSPGCADLCQFDRGP